MLTIADIEISTFHIDKSWTTVVNPVDSNLIIQPDILIIKSTEEDYVVVHLDIKVKLNIDNPNNTFIHLFATMRYKYLNIHMIMNGEKLTNIYDNIVELSYATIRGIIYEKAFPILGKFIVMIPEQKLKYILKDIKEIDQLVQNISDKQTDKSVIDQSQK